MAKIVLPSVSGITDVSVINDNFSKIAQALNDQVLYRDNPLSQPNQMENGLDMNSNDIFNVGALIAKRVQADNFSGSDTPIFDTVGNNELIKWSQVESKFVGTGVTSDKDGELTVKTNSINIGIHDVGSAGRNVMFTNRVDDRHFFPPLQEVGILDSRTTNTLNRTHSSLQEEIFQSDTAQSLISPTWSRTFTNNRTVLQLQFWPEINMAEVVFQVLDQGAHC